MPVTEFQPGSVEISVLKCASCGAPVPFGDLDVVTCVYCAASVEVPEEHARFEAPSSITTSTEPEAQKLFKRWANRLPRWCAF